MNSIEDIVSLEQPFGRKTFSKVKGFGSCSALVKLFDKNEDIAISHVTWTDYNMMLRIFKFYNLSYHMVPSKGLALFSFPFFAFGKYFLKFNNGILDQFASILKFNFKEQ